MSINKVLGQSLHGTAKLFQITRLIISAIVFFFYASSYAATPLWTFTALTPTSITIPMNQNATVQYAVANQSQKPHTLKINPTQGIQQVGICNLAPKGTIGDTCTLTLTITSSELPATGISGGPILCQTNANGSPNPNQCYQPGPNAILNIKVAHTSATLSASVSTLALAVKNVSLNQGAAREITITNIGSEPALNLNISNTGLPSGTSVTSNCPSTLNGSASCTITVTPGTTASSDGGSPCTIGTAPVNGSVTVSTSNTPSVQINLVVLGFGCVYQFGYLFSIDDTTAVTTSIGGKVANLTNLSAVAWDSSTACSTNISGCTVTSATSNNNGANNTATIISVLGSSSGAAGACANYHGGFFTNWYLPAVCEMGYGVNSCGTSTAPAIQNMQSNLADASIGNFASNTSYWSSTEFSSFQAFSRIFVENSVGVTYKNESTNFMLRCVRALT